MSMFQSLKNISMYRELYLQLVLHTFHGIVDAVSEASNEPFLRGALEELNDGNSMVADGYMSNSNPRISWTFRSRDHHSAPKICAVAVIRMH